MQRLHAQAERRSLCPVALLLEVYKTMASTASNSDHHYLFTILSYATVLDTICPLSVHIMPSAGSECNSPDLEKGLGFDRSSTVVEHEEDSRANDPHTAP
jgi:hypothetical protein